MPKNIGAISAREDALTILSDVIARVQKIS